jgi:hypothetical protein
MTTKNRPNLSETFAQPFVISACPPKPWRRWVVKNLDHNAWPGFQLGYLTTKDTKDYTKVTKRTS